MNRIGDPDEKKNSVGIDILEAIFCASLNVVH